MAIRTSGAILGFLFWMAAAGGTAHAQAAPQMSPAEDVEALAQIIGAIHFRRQACVGRDDQTWRQQMVRLMELEAPEDGNRRQRFVRAFNAGYANEERLRPTCAQGREAELRLAAEGRRLSERLVSQFLR